MVITYPSVGGKGKDLITEADLVPRAEMFRVNALRPTLTGDEVMGIVLTSNAVGARRSQRDARAAHLPTHAALVGDNRRVHLPAAVAKSVVASATPRGRVGSDGEICRAFANSACTWGGDCEGVRDSRGRKPSPGLQSMVVSKRGSRRRVANRCSQPL